MWDGGATAGKHKLVVLVVFQGHIVLLGKGALKQSNIEYGIISLHLEAFPNRIHDPQAAVASKPLVLEILVKFRFTSLHPILGVAPPPLLFVLIVYLLVSVGSQDVAGQSVKHNLHEVVADVDCVEMHIIFIHPILILD